MMRKLQKNKNNWRGLAYAKLRKLERGELLQWQDVHPYCKSPNLYLADSYGLLQRSKVLLPTIQTFIYTGIRKYIYFFYSS